MTEAARTAELVTITDGESTHTRTVGEWLDLARRALRALSDAETPGAETNAAGQVPVPERIGGDAGADRAKVLCAERCVQQHSVPAAPSAAPTAVEGIRNWLDELAEKYSHTSLDHVDVIESLCNKARELARRLDEALLFIAETGKRLTDPMYDDVGNREGLAIDCLATAGEEVNMDYLKVEWQTKRAISAEAALKEAQGLLRAASAVEEVEAKEVREHWDRNNHRDFSELALAMYDKALDLARRLEKASVEWDRWMKIASKCQISKDLITGQYESAEAALKEAQGLLRRLIKCEDDYSPEAESLKDILDAVQRHLDSRTGKEQ